MNTTIEPLAPLTQTGLTDNVQWFLKDRAARLHKFRAGETDAIRVSTVLGGLAYFYERIRNIIEYKGDQVLRRNAIERILKRLLWERSSHDARRLSYILIRELIWARYLPNDTIPKRKIEEVAMIVHKYQYFLALLNNKSTTLNTGQIKSWVWGVASCEIEETLDPTNREPYVELMYRWFMAQFTWKNDHLSEHERNIQIYLAIHRALTKSDEAIMRYHLLLKEMPNWLKASETDIQALSERFIALHEEIEKHLRFSDRMALYRLISKQVAPFEVIRELVEKTDNHAPTILAEEETLTQKVKEICHFRYAQIQAKVRRGIIRSIIYIFITKVLFAMLIEIPYELLTLGELLYIPLTINIIIPPLLMFLVGLTIHAPDERNTVRILSILKTIVYPSPVRQAAVFSLARARRGSMLANIFALFYALLFLLVFGGLTYLLIQLHFTAVGIGVFFAFMSLVLLFGFRVRFTAQELKVTSTEESFLSYIFNNVTLPFLSTGVYLSKGLAKLNFFAVFLDFLIEAPLKTIIEVVEEWTSFMREKREDVVEVPQE